MIGFSHNQKSFDIEIELPASKSIHNRVLILNALYDLGLKINNPSNSGDSVLLRSLLKSKSETLNCENAGTVLRFLTAYYAVNNCTTTLTGNQRMLNRPIGELVKTLQQLGANIEYGGPTGYPPIVIKGGLKKGGNISINGDISSQFISALAMIGPKLEGGLNIIVKGKISSRPYIEMTVDLMRSLGFEIDFNNNTIRAKAWYGVSGIKYFDIEPDWSAAAFWFQIISLAPNSKVLLKNLDINSIQGDSILQDWSKLLGINLSHTSKGILLERSGNPVANDTEWDLTDSPDLAPSIIVLLSTLKRKAVFYGLESLKIKESDRTLALQTELEKCKVIFIKKNDKWKLDATNFELKPYTVFEHYDDHRIAMALASLVFINPIRMKDPQVVEKSYPQFWEHLKLTGVDC